MTILNQLGTKIGSKLKELTTLVGTKLDKTAKAADSDLWDGQHRSSRTNWDNNNAEDTVVGQLAWKHYGNSHTIFDASKSLSPDGTSVNNTNPTISWTGTYPTLMGWNGAQTYGLRVDSAKQADTLDGLDSTQFLRTDINDTINGNISLNGTTLFGSKTKNENNIVRMQVNSGYKNLLEMTSFGQGSAELYMGQTDQHGFGLLYNADDTPDELETDDWSVFYRRSNGINSTMFGWHHADNFVTFRSVPKVNGFPILTTADNKIGKGANALNDEIALNYSTAPTSGSRGFFGSLVLNKQHDSWNRIRFDKNGIEEWGIASSATSDFVISKLVNGETNDNKFVIDAITGDVTIDGGKIITETTGKASDSNLLDGLDSSNFVQLNGTAQIWTETGTSTNTMQYRSFGGIPQSTGYKATLEVRSDATTEDAFMAFHVPGNYAVYLGLDADTDKLSVGGWSMSTNSYAIYHEGNKPSPAELGIYSMAQLDTNIETEKLVVNNNASSSAANLSEAATIYSTSIHARNAGSWLNFSGGVDNTSIQALTDDKLSEATIKLNPFGGDVTVNGNSVYHSGNKPTASELGVMSGNKTISASAPSGGNDGDMWIQV